MKKALFTLLFLVLLFASFRGGTWYSQRWAGENYNSGGERPILHYADPMNPANVSDEPGIAPCGMPMEPVYGDGETEGAWGAMPPGTVKITPQKQQIIGVRIGTAEMVAETHGIRTLGRVAADENRIYPLVSAADGWMSYILGNTTGSLVKKNQLLALVKIHNYDFFSWQQRYLTELANIGRRQLPTTTFTGAKQPRTYSGRFPHTAAQAPAAMQADMFPSDEQLGKTPPAAPRAEPSPAEMLPPESPPTEPPPTGNQSSPGLSYSAMQFQEPRPGAPPVGTSRPGKAPRSAKTPPAGKPPASMPDMADHSMHEGGNLSAADLYPTFMREDNILYSGKAMMELLNLGVGEAQLDELGRTGKYVTTIELRSPVTGLLIDRKVSPLEKVERGTECFRVADLSRVWILADVFNTDAQYIQPGMSARISLPRRNKYLEARVSDILPEFDPATRTLKVRLEMNNPDNAFRPEMFVDVEFLVTLPPAITVPVDAVLDSGHRKIVFVALGDGYFEPREVVTGWQFDDRVEIVKGLAQGEQIVISGNFLIDSESRIKQAAAGLMTSPETKNGSAGKEQ
jgi:hypothetical protein